MASAFNPTEAVTFDLDFGHIHMDGAPTRVMVPAAELVALCAAAGPLHAGKLGSAMGQAIGKRVARRLSGAGPDGREQLAGRDYGQVVEQLAGELALVGFGSLSAERWGNALVLVLDQSPLGDAGDELVSSVLQAALFEMMGQPLRIVRIERDGVRARLLLLAPMVGDEVEARLSRGASWGAILAALHTGGAQ